MTLRCCLRIINSLCFHNSGSICCYFLQSNFGYMDANALQTAQEFKLQSQPVKQDKLPSPLPLWSVESFMLLHEISLHFLNLKVSILQTSCRFPQSSCCLQNFSKFLTTAQFFYLVFQDALKAHSKIMSYHLVTTHSLLPGFQKGPL